MIWERGRRFFKWAFPLLFVFSAAALLTWYRADRFLSERTSPEFRDASRAFTLDFRPFTPSQRRASLYADTSCSGLALREGNLYASSGAGIVRLDPAELPEGHQEPSSGASRPLFPQTGEGSPRSFDTRDGFPFLRVAAISAWRQDLVFAFEKGGWGRLSEAGVEEATTSAGTLEIRSLLETSSGELLIGAKQGLFRSVYRSSSLELLDRNPVQTLALFPGGEIISGGEAGLRLVGLTGASREAATPDPWINSVGMAGGMIWAATAQGIAYGQTGKEPLILELHPQGAGLTGGLPWGAEWLAPAGDGRALVVALSADGKSREISSPEPFSRLLSVGGQLFADGPSGLFHRRAEEGWILRVPRSRSALPHPHVNAMASLGTELWLGFFDGGVASENSGNVIPFKAEGPWGVNALLPAGGAIFAATLRGAFRLREGIAEPLEGAGAAFSLAATPEGVAVGYGQGVLLPGKRLLSAFHGLPGNQAYALASSIVPGRLWVGTPSGLGRIDNRRVSLRVIRGEGKLPHPWVTALAETEAGLWIATYGGGAVRLSGEDRAQKWERFRETEGLRVNAGALLIDGEGRILLGTQGQGLWISEPSPIRFRRLRIPLPSPNVFSLALHPSEKPSALFIGTDEGLLELPLPELFAQLRETP